MDESDFLGHLSNSSYAKTCDMVRFKAALQFFPLFFGVGGWMPLAATHYDFIRELPMFAPYEVRLTIHSWDHKWVCVFPFFFLIIRCHGNFVVACHAEVRDPTEEIETRCSR